MVNLLGVEWGQTGGLQIVVAGFPFAATQAKQYPQPKKSLYLKLAFNFRADVLRFIFFLRKGFLMWVGGVGWCWPASPPPPRIRGVLKQWPGSDYVDRESRDETGKVGCDPCGGHGVGRGRAAAPRRWPAYTPRRALRHPDWFGGQRPCGQQRTLPAPQDPPPPPNLRPPSAPGHMIGRLLGDISQRHQTFLLGPRGARRPSRRLLCGQYHPQWYFCLR